MAYKSLQPTPITYKSLQGSPKISSIYNSLFPAMVPTPPVAPSSGGASGSWAPAVRELPNGGGSYESPVITQKAPVVETPVIPPAQDAGAVDYSKYTDPVTGKVMNPQEYADFLAKRVTGGSVPNYAGNSLTQGPQTTEQLNNTATDLNNQRNDIAVGETDPYNAASKSGVAYSPTEMAAIEKAYAGIYDPALKDVFAKLDLKQKEDASALEQKNKLAQMAQQHTYDLELKRTPSGDSSGTTLGGTPGVYVEGADPVVDSYVQRVVRGETIADVLKSIPGVKNQGLRDAINMGVNTQKVRTASSSGNLDTVNTINSMLTGEDLENISGPVQQFTGGLFGDARQQKLNYDQIVGALQLAKAGNVKGQGAVSDYERTTLKQAATAIDRGLSDELFRDALIKIRGATMTASGIEAPVRITNLKTGEVISSTADTQDINELIAEGNLVEYIEQ